MHRTTTFLVCMLALLLPAAAHAQAIDFLEEGPFAFTAQPGPVNGSQAVTLTTCVATTRDVTLTSFDPSGQFANAAQLSVGPGDDEIQMVFTEPGGQLDLRYAPGGVDITQGGSFNRLDVSFSVAVPNGRVEVTIQDGAGSETTLSKLTQDGAHTLSFDVSDFAPTDLGDVHVIRVTLVAPTEGDYHLRDIRMNEVPDQSAAADYVIQNVLGGNADGVNLWGHDQPLDDTHVAVHPNRVVGQLPFPYPLGWLFMVDDQPGANWGHATRWVFVSADLGEHVVYERDFFPAVVGDGGQGDQVSFGCLGLGGAACAEVGLIDPEIQYLLPGLKDGCLYAVLISGGWTDSSNYSRYAENLSSMYQKLRGIGYAKSQIWVYYADGTLPLDLDNADGDGNHFTGNDVTAGAYENLIRARISSLCNNLNANEDVLFIYTSNHGASDGSLMLWDFNGNGNMDPSEGYTPAEFGADTANCQTCRTFAIFDQCYSGAFTPVANDGNHPNTAIYAAATANEVSWGREYLDVWEDLDVDNTTINDLHATVAASPVMSSTAVMAETVPGQTGNVTIDYCWGEDTFYVPSDAKYCGLEGSLEVDVIICNDLPSTQAYELTFQGLPAESGCGDVDGPSLFLMDTPNPIYVPAGQCKTVTVTIGRPDGLGQLGATACYEATLTNLDFGEVHTEIGRVHGTAAPILCMEIPRESHLFLLPHTLVTVVAELTNFGPSASFDYEWDIVSSDELAQNTVYGVNDMAPGEPARGSVFVGEGETVEITAQVLMTEPSNMFADLQFKVPGVQGKRVGEDVLAVVGLRGEPSVATAVGPTPQREVVDLRVSPNPFNPRTTLRFALPVEAEGTIDLDVLDLRGRRVRTLVAGEAFVAGDHALTWDGTDEAGRKVASGAYFFRLRTKVGVTVRSAALIK